jgi:hypothetical protein
MIYSTSKRLTFVLACLFAVAAPAVSQDLMLDQMEEAGGLKMFPVYGDAKTFYYLPDKVTIPEGPDGKPQFSFLKFARNVAGDGEGGIQAGEGGGLVHFLVSFELSDSDRQNAESELQRKVPGAMIAGPLNYKSGTFALISNFQQEGGDWATRVVGLGKAPLMEGHKAAVSIRLTAEGATILWESFKQAASDITVSFEMVVAGYRDSYEMEMTAHWDKVASNRTIAGGLKTAWLGVDVQDTMKQLREEGAIEVKTKGKDEQSDKLWGIAYGMLAKQMFEPDNDQATLATLQDDPDLYSNFEKANVFNKEERARIEKSNKDKRTSTLPFLQTGEEEWPYETLMPIYRNPLLNGGLLAMNNESDEADDELLKKRDAAMELHNNARKLNEIKEETAKAWEAIKRTVPEYFPFASVESEEQICEEVYPVCSDVEAFCEKMEAACGGLASGYSVADNSVTEEPKPKRKPKRKPKKKKNRDKVTKDPEEARAESEGAAKELTEPDGTPKPLTPAVKAELEENKEIATENVKVAKVENDKAKERTPTLSAEAANKALDALEVPPSFSLMASYRKKEFKKTGKFHLSFTNSLPDTQSVTFVENIGGFGKAMLDDKSHFRVINLDDPAYDQREILVQLDGQDAEDFNQFVNVVTVSLRKRHGDGSTTIRELKIDKSNFINSSNNFRMVYGNKGDTDREKWMGFDYRIVWSLHGGLLNDSGWQEYTDGSYVITVGAPHEYRELTVDADPGLLAERNVRLVTLTFRSSLFGKEQSRQVTLRTGSAANLSEIIKYAHVPGDYEYDYDIVWRIRGGETVSSGPLTSADSMIFADELP